MRKKYILLPLLFLIWLPACFTAVDPPSPSSTYLHTVISTPTAATPPQKSPFSSKTPTATATPQPTLTLTPTHTATPSLTSTPTPFLLIAAGDISVCGNDGDDATAKILAGYPQAVILTAGDNSNDSGRLIEYQNCFGPTWGQFLDRIYPSPGNHDYATPGAPGYFTYFGERAGDLKKGYYSFDLGKWHIIALNSNCAEAGGCGIGSPQEQWLRADLQNSAALCTLVAWHHPRWSSGLAGNSGWVSPLWKALADYNVEIVISGHDHHYERFSPQNGEGTAVPAGVRQFIVGTGGAYLNPLGDAIQANSEIRQTGVFGVLLLRLYETYYEWEFLPVEGETFSDSGLGDCY